VQLGELEAAGFRALLPPPNMKGWVEQEVLARRTRVSRDTAERFCREVLGVDGHQEALKSALAG
jgi:hypothetical protein